ncbi:hypothetical protein J6590_103146 [Homalodisca vitripennis]|nr:hypothetical protein J6590_103146 [Homalodisca vitripennis]
MSDSDQQRYSGLLQMRLLFADVYRVSPLSPSPNPMPQKRKLVIYRRRRQLYYHLGHRIATY